MLTHETIKGPAGQLEIQVDVPQTQAGSIVAVICHPHPLYEGSLHNKVVYTVARAMRDQGMIAIRFNFRGVGKSEGQYDKGVGEASDCLAVIDWAIKTYSAKHILLCGFSFGAYIAQKVASVSTYPIKQLISIAPPVAHFDFASLPPVTCPWTLIQGEQDEIISAEGVIDWAKAQTPPPTLVTFPETSHFFHGKLVALKQAVIQAIQLKSE